MVPGVVKRPFFLGHLQARPMWSSRLLLGGRLVGRRHDFTPQPPSKSLLVYEGDVWVLTSCAFCLTGDVPIDLDWLGFWKFVEEFLFCCCEICVAENSVFQRSDLQCFLEWKSRNLSEAKRRKSYSSLIAKSNICQNASFIPRQEILQQQKTKLQWTGKSKWWVGFCEISCHVE